MRKTLAALFAGLMLAASVPALSAPANAEGLPECRPDVYGELCTPPPAEERCEGSQCPAICQPQINRLQERVDSLAAENAYQGRVIARQRAKIERQRARIERLRERLAHDGR